MYFNFLVKNPPDSQAAQYCGDVQEQPTAWEKRGQRLKHPPGRGYNQHTGDNMIFHQTDAAMGPQPNSSPMMAL